LHNRKETRVASVIGNAKKSVDNTVDAYLGRIVFALSVLFALGFALAGIWIVIVAHYGTMVACFVIAAIFVLISLVVHAMVTARERAARANIQAVEKSIEETTAVFPFDLSAVVSILPVVLPLLKSVRSFLPFVIVAGLIATYFISNAETAKDEQTPAQP
jgi:uncharacterized membrane protein